MVFLRFCPNKKSNLVTAIVNHLIIILGHPAHPVFKRDVNGMVCVFVQIVRLTVKQFPTTINHAALRNKHVFNLHLFFGMHDMLLEIRNGICSIVERL